MKRTITMFLALLLCIAWFTSCNKITENTSNNIQTTEFINTTAQTYSQHPSGSDTYGFYNLEDFYLYAEHFEQNLSKYKQKPWTGSGTSLYYRQVKYLVKLEALFPDINQNDFPIESISVLGSNGYAIYMPPLQIQVYDLPTLRNCWLNKPGAMCLYDYAEGRLICEFRADFKDSVYVTITIYDQAREVIKNSSSTELKNLISDDNEIVREQLDVIAKRLQNLNLEPYYESYMTP